MAFVLFVSAQISAFAEKERTISGTVVDENGLTMIGAMVTTADGKRGELVNEKGEFKLVVPASDKVIHVSFLGYLTATVDIAKSDIVVVKMEPDPQNSLNEVVVIGFAEVKKADLTGSVTNVKMSDLQESSNLSVGQALQGRVAGVDIMSTSGDPSSGTSIRIRGTRSISASNEPLIVVDGVMDVVSDLSALNPDDIESISLLKDASASAIYGSRGANGVIMVKTKVGASSKPKIQVSAEFGASQLAKKLDIMNADEFLQYYYTLRGRDIPEQFRDGVVNTDWQDAITRLAPYQNYNASMSGKAQKLDYFIALGYTDNQGIIKQSFNDRLTIRANLGYQITNWLKVSYKGSYAFIKTTPNLANIGGTNLSNGAIYIPPVLEPYAEVNPMYESGTRIDTPLTSLEKREYITEKHDMLHTLDLNIAPVQGLTIKSTVTYKTYQRHDFAYWPNTLSSRLPEQGGKAYIYDANNKRVLNDNTITYKRNCRGGNYFDVMAGFSLSYVQGNNAAVTADGIVSDSFKWYNVNAIQSKEKYTNTSDWTKIIKESFIARANYNYAGKYYLTVTGRYDASSSFAANHKWAFFPSAAFKWSASKERFVQRAKWLNDLSVRASWGITGNDAISPYQSLERYGTSTSNSYVFDGTQPLGVYINRLANPNLTWEKTQMFNAGVDFSVLKGRLNITLDAYASRTTDLLLTVQTALATGYASRYENLGCTTNRGVELTIDSRNIVTNKFQWSTTFTLSHNSQMVEDIGNEEYVSALNSYGNISFMMYGYKKGYPLNSLWGFQYAGTWKNQEEIDRNKITHSYGSALSAAPGVAKYVDQNNDGQIDQKDLIYAGQSDPVVYGGLQNTFHFGKWKLGVYLSYSLGGKIYNFSELFMSGGTYTNQYRYMLNAWTKENPDSYYQKPCVHYVTAPSTFMVHDASYLRLKTVSLAREIPFPKAKGIKSMVVSVTGDNLYLFSSYNGFDPDVSTESDGSVLRRVDKGAYPRARKVTVGVKLNF